MYRPSFENIRILRELFPYCTKIGTPALRRSVLNLIPDSRLRSMTWIVDTIWDAAKDIFYSKRMALEKGEEAMVQQVGEGKDLMSILRALLLLSL